MSVFQNFGTYSGTPFTRSTNLAVRVLIIINIAVFVLINILRDFPWYSVFGLVPALIFSRLMLWQLVTYMFLHAGLWHLVLNMLMLWMFGSVIERSWGMARFLFYYFLTGIGAGLCSVLFAYNAEYPVVGASGSIFGLLVAFAIMFPESVILLFFIFPMKMKHAAVVLAGINMLGALSNPGAGIAYIAHLGGGLFGYVYLKNEKLSFFFTRFSLLKLHKKWQTRKNAEIINRKQQVNKSIDEILDKISAQGLNSLSKEERRILEQRSRGK